MISTCPIDEHHPGTRTLWIDDEKVVQRVFCAASLDSESALLIKPNSGAIRANFLARIENAYSLSSHLDASWAAKPRCIIRDGEVPALLLDDPGGTVLAAEIEFPLSLVHFLETAISITAAVDKLHEAGLIHKDIKPSNILLSNSRDRAWLKGFGIATRLPRERHLLPPPEVIAGTFAYMAPEQTGRMNRSIDPRSDLYALGVTLYQMLTGQLPFVAADPMEWIHCHIARQPIPPAERREGVPQAVSAIVMKLLAKAAEDRYRSAAGLKFDLQHCLEQLHAKGNILPFCLGKADAPNQLIFREKLYGRERETARLTAAFNRVVTNGRSEVVLVSGYSGIGKSSVVNELHRSLVPARALFAAGKFDQFALGIPYATLAQALQTLVRQVMNKEQAELDQWISSLLHAVGVNGQLIVNLVPELEQLIGVQPTVPELSGPEAQNRLRNTLRQFLGVFARPEHPLVLFLDDLQWLDSATLDLIESLINDREKGSLLLIGAYRDSDLGSNHPLHSRLAALLASGIPVEQIRLEGIGLDDIRTLVSEALGVEAGAVSSLAQLVFDKAGGNPFFTTHFVTSLFDEGLLHFDTGLQCWRWDEQLIAAKHMSENVVDLMIERLRRLPTETQHALKQFACLGSDAKAATLARILGSSVDETKALLHEAARAGLVFQVDDAYAFSHDRVREAAYAIIADHEKGPAHWLIGLQLLSDLPDQEVDSEIFDIVNQFNRANVSTISRADRITVASLNLRAGRKAKAAAAFVSACDYFEQGYVLIDEDSWSLNYDLSFALAVERAESTFLKGDLAAADLMLQGLLEHDLSEIDRATVYRLNVSLCVVRSDNIAAVKSAVAGLEILGFRIPADPTWDDVQREYDAIWHNLRDRAIEDFSGLPEMRSENALAAMRILAEAQPPAYFTNFNLTILVICKMVNLSLTQGIASTSAQGLALFGYVLGPAFGRYKDGYRIAGIGAALAASRNGPIENARVHHLTGLAAAWTEPLPVALDWLRSAFRRGAEAGDLYYSCFAAAVIVLHVFHSGKPLDEVDRECREALSFARGTGFQAGANLTVATERAVASLRGKTRGLSVYDDVAFDSAAFEADLAASQNSVVSWWYWTRKLMVHVLAGEYSTALEAGRKVVAQSSIRNMQIEQMDYHYFMGLALAALIDTASDEIREIHLRELKDHHARLKDWAKEAGSPTFDDKHTLLEAEIARIEGKILDAQELYESSIELARSNSFLSSEAVANESAARFYQRRGLHKIALTYLRESHLCYGRWGADAKVRLMEAEFPAIRSQTSSQPLTNTAFAQVDQLDLATVMKVAQAVSGEIVLERLIDALMRVTMEHAGAARAVLMLASGSEIYVAAEATMTGAGVSVDLKEASSDEERELPSEILTHVAQFRETVILDNAQTAAPFSTDPYVVARRVRSLLAMPLLNQGKLIGLLYLENNLVANVFTGSQISILKLVACHAAVALENTRLYKELAERESRIRRLVDSNIIGVMIWKFDGRIVEANDSFLSMLGFSRAELNNGLLRWTDLSPPEELESDARALDEVLATGIARPWEKEFFHREGSRVPVLIGAATFGDPEADGGVAYVLDLTARRKAEEDARASDRRYRELHAELAHANRVATVGQLSAAISHELRQPLVGVVSSGSAGLRWLDADPPNLNAARRALQRTVSEGHRAAEVLGRIKALVTKAPLNAEIVDVNALVSDTLSLVRGQILLSEVRLEVELDVTIPSVRADRVQIQQVILNLILNALEAMAPAGAPGKELKITTGRESSDMVFVAVLDNGPGIPREHQDRIYEAFYSTKEGGMGMGLAICQTIIATYGGKLQMSDNHPRGAAFRFALPTIVGAAS